MSEFLSIVVISYKMARELPRTLWSLSPQFQEGISADEYEVIVVDNGSPTPPVLSDFADYGLDLTILTTESASPSPAAAINRGLNAACGAHIGVFIDGARLASPGLLRRAREALHLADRPVVASRGRYLGKEMQRESIAKGYNQATEDALLDRIQWRENGYKLFDISVFDESSGPTWFSGHAESNSLFMPRALWKEINGFDERFALPGGGLVNLDTWDRAVHLPGVEPISLIGEATFHQVHGGVATNVPLSEVYEFFDDYKAVTGRRFEKPRVRLTYWGAFVAEPPAREISWDHPSPWSPTSQSFVRRLANSLSSHLPPAVARKLGTAARYVLWTLTGRLAQGRQQLATERANADLVRNSDLFEAQWYLERYPDVRQSGYEPALHYAKFGGLQGRQPGPQFDAIWYLEHHPDVAGERLNPLVHYLRYGLAEGRRTQPMNDGA